MKRVAALVFALVVAGVLPTRWLLARPRADPRPNIVLLLLDDQDEYSPFWDAMPQTAAMSRDRGCRFSTAFAPTPICSPGRVTLLSGRLAHNTNVFTLIGPTGGANFNSQVDRTFAVELSRLGYRTALLGKTWGSTQINPGWDVWCALGGDHLYEGYNYEVTQQSPGSPGRTFVSGQYSTDFLSDRVSDFLNDQGSRPEPFFVMLAPTAPHLPLPPAPRHQAEAKARWKGRLPMGPDYNERDVADKSIWLRKTAAVRSRAVPYAPKEYPNRMGSLLAVDEMMGRVRDILIAQGKWDNTIIVVTSDNGYNLGAHRLIHKMAPYEESIRIPLVIAGPGVESSDIHKMVGLQDLGSTFIALAGGIPPSYYDGKSLVPFLLGGSDDVPGWRTSFIAEYNTGGVFPGYNPGGSIGPGYELDIPTYRAVRTETHKFIRFPATRSEELYDLVNDPFELNNLLAAKKPAAPVVALRNSLAAQLDALQGCAGGNCP